MLDVQFAVNEVNLQVEEPGSVSSLVREPDGNIIAALAESVGLAPVDLTQEPVVDPRVRTVGELASQEKAENGFAFLDLYATDRSAKVFRFANPKNGFFPFVCLAGPKVAHLRILLAWAPATMKPWLEIHAQGLVGNFSSIGFLGTLHPDTSGCAGMEVNGGNPGDFGDALLLGQGDDNLFLSLGQFARPVIPLNSTGFSYAGRSLLRGAYTRWGDGVQVQETRKSKC